LRLLQLVLSRSIPRSAQNPCFTFLLLPAEIRLHLYGLLFKFDTPVVPQGKYHDEEYITFRRPGDVLLAIVLANTQLSQEVTHFLYSNNNFAIRDPGYFRDWLTHIGPRNASFIPEVIVVDESHDDEAWPTDEQVDKELHPLLFALQKHATNLQAITVHGYDALSDMFQGLDRFGSKCPMSTFPSLQRIAFERCHWSPPDYERQFYERFFCGVDSP
jgi:hypothetical protein